MDQITKLKEATKTGLAFMLVFGIAMKLDWMNPYWAGWAVAVIALPTAGASIRKGMQRVVGTIPGCLAALAIHAIACQSRWLFLFLTCSWVFFTVYLVVSRKKDSYVWVMSCYVCLMILLSDLDSSANMFESAVFRTLETLMGVVVYTLISVFVWPQTNLGAIRKSSGELVAGLSDLCRSGGAALRGLTASQTNFSALQEKSAQQLAKLMEALEAEGSESYEVSQLQSVWEQFNALSTRLLERAGRLQASYAEISETDLREVFPTLPKFFAELDARFDAIGLALAGKTSTHRPLAISVCLDAAPSALSHLSHFDRAAVTVIKKELEQLDTLTEEMLGTALELDGQTPSATGEAMPIPTKRKSTRKTWLPVPDWDHLRYAAFVTATTGIGFLIWILFDPPGHSAWFQVTGTVALMVAICPQLRASKLIMPVAVTSVVCLAIYVFIMPQLSSFLGLGTLLFTTMFLNCFLFSGMARFFCSMAILNMLPIQNQQLYSFPAMANMLIFLVMCFAFLYMMSYLLGSPRPEKTLIHLFDRFFRSAEFLMSRKVVGPVRFSAWNRWRFVFHQRQLRSMPAKLAAWGKAIDQKSFPSNSPEQIQTVVSTVQTLVYRIEQFIESGEMQQAESLVRDLRADVKIWHVGIESAFGRWAQNPEGEPVAPLRERLEVGLAGLEERIGEAINQTESELEDEAAEHFFRLLGAYRGVSEAALAYAGAAQQIDWNHWREERFS